MRRSVLSLMAVVLVAALGACSEPSTDNAAYHEIAAIMDNLNAQWSTPGVANARGMIVTGRVCPAVTVAGLESMTGDKSLSGNVEYKYYEKSLAYADKSRNWTITRPLSWTKKQVLMISISPRDGCVAIYRHIN